MLAPFWGVNVEILENYMHIVITATSATSFRASEKPSRYSYKNEKVRISKQG